MRVLLASSEIYPYAKSGGLGDISAALLDALAVDECELFGVMPLYSFVKKRGLEKVRTFSLLLGEQTHKIELYVKKEKKHLLYFIKTPLLSDTKGMYTDGKDDYRNNDERFALFSKAIASLAIEENIDILHLNDWHTALVALYLQEQKAQIKTVFTIHNLAYQGIFSFDTLQKIGVDSQKYFHLECLEFYTKVNYLKAGIALSDRVVTVSPRYAQEIQTAEYGCGLEGFLQHHSDKLYGILNGIDQKEFNPKKDKALYHPYSVKKFEKKYLNKKELLEDTGLKDPRKPLFVMISRLVDQKGIHLLLELLEDLLQERVNVMVLGEGVQKYEEALEEIQSSYANFVFEKAYDEKRSRQLYGAADFLLMPSLFEPCGLSQLIAMRYGTVPIVHKVGGLFDTVHEQLELDCGRGFVFESFTKESFFLAVERALELKKKKKEFELLQKENMGCDFSLAKSAQKYLDMYKTLL